MTQLGSITCEAPVDAPARGLLPVHIRDRNGDVVAQGVTGLPIPVPAGHYFATVLLPDGREIGVQDAIAVSGGSGERCTAGLCAAESGQQMDVSVTPAPASSVPVPPAAVATASVSTLQGATWRGNWFNIWDGDDHKVRINPDVPVMLSTSDPLVLEGSNKNDQLLVFSALSHRGPITRYIIVPYDLGPADDEPSRRIMAKLERSTGTPEVCFRTFSDEVNTLLSFVEAGILTNMMTVATEMVKRIERGAGEAPLSIMGGITGSYILLRNNALDSVEDWLTQLDRLEPGLPDVEALRVELLGRMGRHDEAVELLRRMVKGRAPWFRAGLSYLLERLRLYVDVTNNPNDPFALSPEDKANFKYARNKLELVLPLMDNSRYIATFDVPDIPA